MSDCRIEPMRNYVLIIKPINVAAVAVAYFDDYQSAHAAADWLHQFKDVRCGIFSTRGEEKGNA